MRFNFFKWSPGKDGRRLVHGCYLLRAGDLDRDICNRSGPSLLVRFSAKRLYIADASYWLYLIHLPIVMALQVMVSTLDWPWPVKFATILLIAFPVMFASYQVLVRYRVLGAVLNGRRMQKGSKPPLQTFR